jgi:hypothetical protein
MFDPFLLLTPILMLGVVALLGFVGCNLVYGLDETKVKQPPPAPVNLHVTAVGDGRVDLAWDPPPTGGPLTQFRVNRQNGQAISFSVPPTEPSFTDTTAVNGTAYGYFVTAVNSAGEGAQSNFVLATSVGPLPKPFVTAKVNGSVHNDFPAVPGSLGLLGMIVLVGPLNLRVTALGRYIVSGNSTVHLVKIVDENSSQELGSASVQTLGKTPNTFEYGDLVNTVVLTANSRYYVVAQETSGGDFSWSSDTHVDTEPDATVVSAVYNDPTTDNVFHPAGSAGNSYGPVNFKYVVVST